MKKYILGIFVMALALFIVGCTTNYNSTNSTGQPYTGYQTNTTPPISGDAVISYMTSGGFINPQFGSTELNITSATETFTVYDANTNAVVRQIVMPTDSATFSQLRDSLNNDDLIALADTYGGRNPDTGTVTITVSEQGFTKSVTLGTIGDTPPDALTSIVSQLAGVEDSVLNPAAPDFTQYGYSSIASSQISAGEGADITQGPYTFNIPQGTFSNDVLFEILEADPSLISAYSPSGETPILTFAVKVTDLTTNQLITNFSGITVKLDDSRIDSNTKYYNVAPSDVFTENENGVNVQPSMLSHPIKTASVAWAITIPGNNTMNANGQVSGTAGGETTSTQVSTNTETTMNNETSTNTETTMNSSVNSPSYLTTLTRLNSENGPLVVDNNDMTLYTFSTDSIDNSTCYGACAQAWPPALVNSNDPPASLDVKGTVGVMTRTDGTYQATYNGMPLYYFIKDKNVGDAFGNNFYGFGGTWYVVDATSTTNNSPTMVTSSSSGSSSGGSSGGGY